mgnify:CR=1 FL=1
MSKRSRKRNKKILAALALAGGAAMLAKGRGKATVSGVGQDAEDINIGIRPGIFPPRKRKWNLGGVDPGPSLAAKGGRIGKKHGGRTGKQFGGGLNRPVARPVGGVGAPVRPLAYKHGGKVKSMGVAKRGGGVAKR